MASDEQLPNVLRQTLSYARERKYCGYDKADGLSSRLLSALPIENKWLNLAFQETVKRAPVNVRPLLLVDQRRNFKGMALFAAANLRLWELTGEDRFKQEARVCLEWLLENQNPGYAGFCGGHQHDVQGMRSKVPSRTPGVVGTSYAVRALLEGDTIDDRYVDAALSAPAYVFQDLDYQEADTGARIRYKPSSSTASYTLNANALGARLLIDVYEYSGTNRYKEAAQEILEYVADNQTDAGGWMYRDPPSASHLGMDNYHNGFIIESFLRYQKVVDEDAYADVVERALDFYRHNLYDDDGAPYWDESSQFPRDIHAAAQGIIVFTHAGDLAFARRIIDWTLEHLYAGDGRFYYQQRKYYTKKFTLMRWCQAWMAYALSEYLRVRDRS